MANFDTASKKTAEISPKDFVDLCFGFQTIDITNIELIQPEQPTVDMRQADVVIKAEIDGKQVIVHFEFQTTDSSEIDMPLRMAGYIVRLIETYGLEVYSNVIYLRPNAGGRDPGQFVQDIAGHEVLTRYKVFRLIEMDGQTILEAKPMGLLPFTPLMKRPTDVSAEAWLRRCVQTADSLKLENKTVYLGTLAVLSSLVYQPETILSIISEETMERSSIAEHFAAEALQQGIEQGLEQGIEQGARERALKDILEALT
ncbi:MAG: hypothetical protein OXI24_08565, partial [Candidatus Poribacteria bacterium]|nr:hypothetical protein [Candidatus Poribacteria bacterium]